MSQLNEKVVLITGASSGIGEAITTELGKAGATVVLGARRLERVILPKGATPTPRMTAGQYRRYGMDYLLGLNPLAFEIRSHRTALRARATKQRMTRSIIVLARAACDLGSHVLPAGQPGHVGTPGGKK